MLQSIAARRQISLICIRSPSGYPDALAKKTLVAPLYGPEPSLPVSFAVLKGVINSWKDEMFAKHLRSPRSARQAEKCVSININHSKYLLSVSKRNVKSLTHIITGNCPLNKHHRFVVVYYGEPLFCNKCGEIETAEHFLCRCPAVIDTRIRHIGTYKLQYTSTF